MMGLPMTLLVRVSNLSKSLSDFGIRLTISGQYERRIFHSSKPNSILSKGLFF
jgi:hypothetical protein